MLSWKQLKKEGSLRWRLPHLPSSTVIRHVCLGGALARPCTILVSARLQNAHRGSCRSRQSIVIVVLLASKAAWQLARVKCSVLLASASLHTLPRRARAPCRCRVCAATQGSPKTFVVKEAYHSLGDGGDCGVIFLEGENKLVSGWNMHVDICNMHVETQHLFLMWR